MFYAMAAKLKSHKYLFLSYLYFFALNRFKNPIVSAIIPRFKILWIIQITFIIIIINYLLAR